MDEPERAPESEVWPWPHFPQGATRNHRYDRVKGEKFTGWEGDFLGAFRQSGIIAYACEQARISPGLVRLRRAEDPRFAAAFKEADEHAIELAETALRMRAVQGVRREKQTFGPGKDGVPMLQKKETVIEYSDQLLMFYLRAKRPEVYRETIDHNHNYRVMLDELHRIAEQEHWDEDTLAKAVEEAERIIGKT